MSNSRHPIKSSAEVARRSLLSLNDLSDEELNRLVERTVAYKTGSLRADRQLKDQIIGLYFRTTSTRTRTAFHAAALRLGARTIQLGPDELQTNTGESLKDTAKVLSLMLDGLVIRTAGNPSELRMFADQQRMSVINAMTADEHPTQAIGDLATMTIACNGLKGIRVLYLGEGNNTAAALSLALSRYEGTALHLRTPQEYGLSNDMSVRGRINATVHNSFFEERHDLSDLPKVVDIVYTTRWQTTGTTKEDPNWKTYFKPFSVNAQLMNRYPEAKFMHDLPAHRGDEVEADVLDGPSSIAFDQAENKLYSAIAILEWCLVGFERQV